MRQKIEAFHDHSPVHEGTGFVVGSRAGCIENLKRARIEGFDRSGGILAILAARGEPRLLRGERYPPAI
jgi:hypothetical protein